MGFSGPPSEPDVRLSPHPALHMLMPLECLTKASRSARPRIDSARWRPCRGETSRGRLRGLPPREKASHQGVHVQPEMPFAEPTDDPPEGEVIDVAEGS